MPDDLADAQMAREAHLAGEAESAVERAADLARQAQRDAVGLAHEDGFDRSAAGEFRAVLDGLVVGAGARTELAGIAARLLEQPPPQCPGQIGPVLRGQDVAPIEPAVHLAGVKLGDVVAGQPGGQTVPVQPVKVDRLWTHPGQSSTAIGTVLTRPRPSVNVPGF